MLKYSILLLAIFNTIDPTYCVFTLSFPSVDGTVSISPFFSEEITWPPVRHEFFLSLKSSSVVSFHTFSLPFSSTGFTYFRLEGFLASRQMRGKSDQNQCYSGVFYFYTL